MKIQFWIHGILEFWYGPESIQKGWHMLSSGANGSVLLKHPTNQPYLMANMSKSTGFYCIVINSNKLAELLSQDRLGPGIFVLSRPGSKEGKRMIFSNLYKIVKVTGSFDFLCSEQLGSRFCERYKVKLWVGWHSMAEVLILVSLWATVGH